MQPPSLLSRLERDLEHASDEIAAEAALRIGEHLAGEGEASLISKKLLLLMDFERRERKTFAQPHIF